MRPAQIRKGKHTIEGAFQLTNVGLHAPGNVLQDIMRYLAARALGFGAENREAGLEVRWLDIGGEAPLEARAQSLVQSVQGLGRPVGGYDNLLVLPVQGIERVEKLFLRRF